MPVDQRMRINSQLAGDYAEGEQQVRQDLAACYHLMDFYGWNESIFNHISARVPGSDGHFLINPFGLNYNEITASNLVKVDQDGNAVGNHDVNFAGFLIHSAIHGARADAHCVLHAHPLSASAVAGKQNGLNHNSFSGALLYGKVAYHDFEGVTLHAEEKARLVEHIGAKPVMILRNHGVLVTGQTVAEAFFRMWTLMDACNIQLAVDSASGPDIELSPNLLAASAALGFDGGGNLARPFFDAAIRRMETARSGHYVDFAA